MSEIMNVGAVKFCKVCGKELVLVDNKCQACGEAYEVAAVFYAGFWKRLVAMILDQILIGSAFSVATQIGMFALVIQVMTVSPESMPLLQTVYTLVFNVLLIVVGWLYFACMESSKYQGTLGKMVLGIKVTGIDGEKISFAKATGRHFGKIISALLLMVGFLMAAFTAKKQALHDIMANCLVVNKK